MEFKEPHRRASKIDQPTVDKMEETEIKIEVEEDEPLALVKRVVEVEEEQEEVEVKRRRRMEEEQEEVEVSTTTPGEYLVTSSGGRGEPGAILQRIEKFKIKLQVFL